MKGSSPFGKANDCTVLPTSVQAARELFGDENAALGWLKRPRSYFQERTLLDVARSEYGVRKVLELSAQLDVGAYV